MCFEKKALFDAEINPFLHNAVLYYDPKSKKELVVRLGPEVNLVSSILAKWNDPLGRLVAVAGNRARYLDRDAKRIRYYGIIPGKNITEVEEVVNEAVEKINKSNINYETKGDPNSNSGADYFSRLIHGRNIPPPIGSYAYTPGSRNGIMIRRKVEE